MIRTYQPGDHEAIAEIFPRAVHEIASQHYTPAQCDAWSDRAPNPAHWKMRCENKRPFVFVADGRVVGFLELDPNGHIACTYVHPDYARQGIASHLIAHAITVAREAGLPRIFVEASICARGVFEKLGFCVTQQRTVAIRNQELANYDMELILDGTTSHSSRGGEESPR